MLLVFLEMLQEYHTGRIRMVVNLTDDAFGRQSVDLEAAGLKPNACMWRRARLA